MLVFFDLWPFLVRGLGVRSLLCEIGIMRMRSFAWHVAWFMGVHKEVVYGASLSSILLVGIPVWPDIL